MVVAHRYVTQGNQINHHATTTPNEMVVCMSQLSSHLGVGAVMALRNMVQGKHSNQRQPLSELRGTCKRQANYAMATSNKVVL